MKRANSNELPLLVEARDCPVDSAAVRRMAESVLTQSQVTPLDPTKVEVPLPTPWLYVNVACVGGGAAFRTDVDFVGQQGADLVRWSLSSYSGLGTASDRSGSYILGELKQRVEAAVADYVKANAETEPETEVAPAPSRRSNRSR